MVQRAMRGPELSIDCLGDLDGRCLNAIPRTMLESRGGESIKGQVVRDAELTELGRRVMEELRVRGPATIQVFRDPDVGLGITDVNTRFGGAFPAPAYAALPGRSYPELIVRLAAGESVAPHVGEFRGGDDVHPLLLAARARREPRADGPRDRRGRAARAALARGSCVGRRRARLESRPVGPTLAETPPPEQAEQPAPAGVEDSGAATPAQPPERAARTCAKCGAAMQPAQDWCLQCGAGASGSLERTGPSWRSAGVVIGATAVLVLGAAAAGYAALSKEGARPHVVRAIVAQAPAAPATATPPATTTTPTPAAGAAGTPQLFGTTTAKPPKIPITPLKLPKISGAVPALPGVKIPLPKTKLNTPVTPVTPAKPTKPSSGSGGSGSTPSVTVTEPMLLDTNAAATYNPYSYPATELRRPEPRDRRRPVHGMDRAGQPVGRAEDGGGARDRPEEAHARWARWCSCRARRA